MQQNQQSYISLRLILLIAGAIFLFCIAKAAVADECPPPHPITEIRVLIEVSNEELWVIVNKGGAIIDLEKEDGAVLKIIPKSERVEAYSVIDSYGNQVEAVGVFAEIYAGTSMETLELQGCAFVAKTKKENQPST